MISENVPPEAADVEREITSDDIVRNRLRWAFIDEVTKGKKGAIVVNTDTKKNAVGVHWITVVPKLGFVYDPLGPSNPRRTATGEDSDEILAKRLYRRSKRPNEPMFHPDANQSIKSVMCGYYAMYAAKLINDMPPDSTRADITKMLRQRLIPGHDNTAILESVYGTKK